MVTGDHPVTARAIARSVNIMPGETIDEIAKRTGQVPCNVMALYWSMSSVSFDFYSNLGFGFDRQAKCRLHCGSWAFVVLLH